MFGSPRLCQFERVKDLYLEVCAMWAILVDTTWGCDTHSVCVI
jgi:hypothetical protein